MKKLPLLCLATLSMTTYGFAEEPKLQESNQPTWIERLFGIGNDKDAKEEVEETKEIAKEKAEKAEKAEDKAKNRKFTEEEREVLESWQKGNASWKKSKKPLPPGLQKKVARGGELPPGWKKKLEVGEVLDPEVDEVAETLPEEILRRLPESEVGAEIVRVGTQIIKVIKGSREIIDIIDGDSSGSSDD